MGGIGVWRVDIQLSLDAHFVRGFAKPGRVREQSQYMQQSLAGLADKFRTGDKAGAERRLYRLVCRRMVYIWAL